MPWRCIGKLEIQLPPFFTLALGGREWPTSHPGCFTSEERDLSSHKIKSWVDPRADLDILKQKLVSCTCHSLNPDFLGHNLRTALTMLPGCSCPCTSEVTLLALTSYPYTWDSLKTSVMQDAEVVTLCVCVFCCRCANCWGTLLAQICSKYQQNMQKSTSGYTVHRLWLLHIRFLFTLPRKLPRKMWKVMEISYLFIPCNVCSVIKLVMCVCWLIWRK